MSVAPQDGDAPEPVRIDPARAVRSPGVQGRACGRGVAPRDPPPSPPTAHGYAKCSQAVPKPVLDQLLAPPHLRLGLSLARPREIGVPVRVRSDRDESGVADLLELGPRQRVRRRPCAVRDEPGRQVEDGRHAVLGEQRQHRLMEVAVPVVERDQHASVRIAGEDIAEREHALFGDQILHLAFERLNRQLDLGAAGTHPVVQQDDDVTPPPARRPPQRGERRLRSLPGQRHHGHVGIS